jgi:hypothetical protein
MNESQRFATAIALGVAILHSEKGHDSGSVHRASSTGRNKHELDNEQKYGDLGAASMRMSENVGGFESMATSCPSLLLDFALFDVDFGSSSSAMMYLESAIIDSQIQAEAEAEAKREGKGEGEGETEGSISHVISKHMSLRTVQRVVEERREVDPLLRILRLSPGPSKLRRVLVRGALLGIAQVTLMPAYNPRYLYVYKRTGRLCDASIEAVWGVIEAEAEAEAEPAPNSNSSSSPSSHHRHEPQARQWAIGLLQEVLGVVGASNMGAPLLTSSLHALAMEIFNTS